MSCVNKSNKDYIRLAERYGDTIAESIVRTISKTKGLVEEFHIPSILEAKKFLKTANSNKLQKIKKGLKANPYLTEKGIVDYLQGVVSKFENQYYVVKGFSYGITSKEAAAKEIFEPNLEIVKTIASEYPDIFKIQETGKEQTVIVKITPKKQFLEIVTPPTIEQGKLFQEAGRATQEVKPGVQELFESNPELADAVYEALGFNGNVSKYQFPIYKGDVSKLETEGEGVSFFTRDKEAADYYTSSRQEQGISPKTNSTFKGYLDTKNPLIVDALKPSPIELKDANGNVLGVFGQKDYIQKVKDAGYDAIIINKKFGNSLDGWEIVSFNRNQIKTNLDTQITPQQKQQAQQLYSQYLDTIFPDSKVKDIVYHGSKTKKPTEIFVEVFIGKNHKVLGAGKGFYFTKDFNYGKIFGEITFSIIDVKNPIDFNSNDYDSLEELEQATKELSKNGDGVIDSRENNYYPKGEEKLKLSSSPDYIVFKPEQIHILGTKQDIEGFKEFVGKEEVELSPEEMYQKSLDLSDKEIEDRINKCRL